MGGDTLRLGVMGTADIAVNRVIKSLKRSKKVDVHAISSREASRAREWAKKLEIDNHYGSYEEMLKNSAIDAVYIPLPNTLHCGWTIRALEAGKHVMCEKPLAMKSEEVRQMIKVAREKGLVLMEGFMYRFHPRNRDVLEMAKGGTIGEVKTVESSFSYVLDDPSSYLMSRELGGGALYDIGCYCVNVARWIIGSEPVEVYGMYNLTATNVDMTFSGQMRFPRGKITSFYVSMAEEPRFYYRVIGDKGLIEVPGAFVSFGKQTSIVIQKNEKREEKLYRGTDEYRLEFENFAGAVLEKKPLPYNIEDSLKNVYVLEALLKSAQEGKPVRV
jgi:xylose dehydrogenase (NAD/NADP)